MPDIVVVMGVSGVGKTTVAEGIAGAMGWAFAEGDDFHSASAVAKMRGGTPLTDEDRRPWLERIRDWIAERIDRGESAVVTCSSLRRAHRDLLRRAGPEVRFLHLAASERLIAHRMSRRRGHFMPISLLHSQIETLEELSADELRAGSVVVSAEGSAADVIHRCLLARSLRPHQGNR